jgi:phage shock protein C
MKGCMTMDKRLYRSRDDQMICGVCSGFARYFNIDPTIIRILFLIALFTWGSGVLIYIICSIVIPLEPIGNDYNTYDYNKENRHNKLSSGNGRMIIGILLVIIGGISILEKIFDWFSFDLVWPIAIIGIGFLILTKDRN